jgi:Acetoacetate decarboxylase (ADC)
MRVDEVNSPRRMFLSIISSIQRKKKMPYPPAPWKVVGFVLQTLRLIPVEAARPFVPSDLELVSVLPGKTLSAVYTAIYGPGSMLEYNELIISPALTRRGGTIRFWISHIYVDNEDSMAGGREIWGLPKEMAQFTWSEDRRSVDVRQDTRGLCSLRSNSPTWLVPMPILLPTFGILESSLLSFMASIWGRVGLAGSQLDVPADSPFAALNLSPKGLGLSVRNMRMTAGAPRVVTELQRPALADH